MDSDDAVLGEYLLIGLETATGLPNRGVMQNSGLYVLRRTYMPAVLMEIGFITNEYDRYLMTTDPESFARGLYNGLLSYFGLA